MSEGPHISHACTAGSAPAGLWTRMQSAEPPRAGEEGGTSHFQKGKEPCTRGAEPQKGLNWTRASASHRRSRVSPRMHPSPVLRGASARVANLPGFQAGQSGHLDAVVQPKSGSTDTNEYPTTDQTANGLEIKGYFSREPLCSFHLHIFKTNASITNNSNSYFIKTIK